MKTSSVIRLVTGLSIGLLLVFLPGLAIAGSQIEPVSALAEGNAVPFEPAKEKVSEPQQGPPPDKKYQPRGSQQGVPEYQVGFLTGRYAGDPLDIARDYIRRNKDSLGLTDNDLADIVVKDRYVSKHNRVTHIYLRQRLNGIEVFNGDININISGDGEVINLGNQFVPDLKDTVNVTGPSLTAGEAVNQAAQHLGLTITDPLVVRRSIGGAEQAVILSDGGISLEDIPVKLIYQPNERTGETRLAWQAIIRMNNGRNWWNIRVDAENGDILGQNDWIAQDTYNVFALPKEHPNDGPRTQQVNPADATASPFGWHDTNGVAGPEFTVTRGNNVSAQDDVDANNSGGFQPDGGPGLVFDFPLNLGLAPTTYLSASIANLFYWNNILHDIHYHYGFDEAGGNFQQNNYGNPGLGSDPVQADAQDGSSTNNANFGTPPDGSDPRMQMFIWTGPTPDRDSALDNGVIIHEYGHGVSNRLTGGPSNVNCLNNAEQMGEGWSDLQALFFSAVASDNGPDARGIGTYVLDQPPTGPGIRNFPYSTNMVINPQTYDSIKSTNIPHGVGEVWATIVWEVYWNLIDIYGFDPDLYSGSGGNNIAMQLVMDGMKLQPCSPTFVEGRDAILLADQVNNGGANQCVIWEGFAKRGLGLSANAGSRLSVTDGTEAFDLPQICLNELILVKSADPSPAQEGQLLSYSLLATNGTAGSLTGVSMIDTIPAGTTYIPGSASDGGTQVGPNVQWSIGTMAPDEMVTRTFQVTVDPDFPSDEVTLFSDDMETGGGNWTATGLWHLEEDSDACGNSFSSTTSWYYGQSPGCTYNTGIANSGQLTTVAPISLPSSLGNLLLRFWSWEDTEDSNIFDAREVLISTNGSSFTSILNLTNEDAAWYEVEVDLSEYAGQDIWLRFEFDTLDSILNNFPGWYLDDVSVVGAPTILNTGFVVADQGDSDTDILSTPVIKTAVLDYTPVLINETMQLSRTVTNTLILSNTGALSLTYSIIEREIPASCTLVNDDYETGDLTGWITVDGPFGGWFINDGTYNRNVDGATTPPLTGSFSAMVDQTGGGTNILYQDVAVPAAVSGTVTLSWIDQWENHAGTFTGAQEFRVELYGPGGAPFLAELFSTQPGDPILSGSTTRAVDVTSLVTPYAGQNVRLQFVEEDSLFFFNVQVDDAQCSVGAGWASTNPISGTIPPFSQIAVDVLFDSNTVSTNGDYQAELRFSGNMDNSVPLLPLSMRVADLKFYLPILLKQ